MARKILLSWSSGKDSAWSLHVLRQSGDYEIAGLLTTFNGMAGRVAMHGIRRVLVEAQAHAAALPLWDVDLPWPCSNQDYELAMRGVARKALEEGVEAIAFGDLYLEEVRAYREKSVRDSGLEPLFPIWGVPTRDLAFAMLDGGVHAKLACVDSKQLSADFAGREFDRTLLAELPASADPCGENGEFHSFVYAGPMFETEIAIEVGEIVRREQFVFVDLIPTGDRRSGKQTRGNAVPLVRVCDRIG